MQNIVRSIQEVQHSEEYFTRSSKGGQKVHWPGEEIPRIYWRGGEDYLWEVLQTILLDQSAEKVHHFTFFRVLERTNGGKELSWKFLKEMIIEELNIIKINQPDRDFARISCKNGNIIEMTYVRRFAERNNLSRFLLQKFTKPNRNFECDICGSRFTMKNVLEAHRKRIHFSFLQ